MDFASIKLEVENLLRLDVATDAAREANGELVANVLRHLDTAIETVAKEAKGSVIPALAWINGVGYANLARTLTEHFRAAGWLSREENASALWVIATLAVCAHYHHMVGPAMIANADCQDRLGDAARAVQLYAAVVKDFAFLADDALEEDDESLAEQHRVALKSLQTAVERLLSRKLRELDGIDLLVLRSKVADLLANN